MHKLQGREFLRMTNSTGTVLFVYFICTIYFCIGLLILMWPVQGRVHEFEVCVRKLGKRKKEFHTIRTAIGMFDSIWKCTEQLVSVKTKKSFSLLRPVLNLFFYFCKLNGCPKGVCSSVTLPLFITPLFLIETWA